MFTKLTTTLMAGALVLASTITPTEVRAGSEARNIIAGIAVGAIVGAAIASKGKKNTHHHGHVSRKHHHGHASPKHHHGHHKGYSAGHHRNHHPKSHKRVSLPDACRVHSSHRSGYSGRCLSGYNYDYAALPSACAVRVGGHHGTIYRDTCLNRYGYR